MGLCAIVTVACHFAGPSQLCITTIARLEAAMAEALKTDRPWRHIFMVTGDVPYEPGGRTLAELMRDYLLAHGVKNRIIIVGGKTGTFAEPRLVTETLRSLYRNHAELSRITVVSSAWQLRAGLPFWQEYAGRAFLQLRTVPICNTGGWRTRLFYAVYGPFLRIARASGAWPKLEPLLYRWLYAPRYTKGFRANGCA